MNRFTLIAIAALIVAGAGAWYLFASPTGGVLSRGGPGEGTPYTSGINGTISIGPTCPAQRNPPDPACADKPYSMLVYIFRKSDMSEPFLLARSDERGAFNAPLPPGEYVIQSDPAGVPMPRCNPTNVTVVASKYKTVAVSCDTGIR